MSNDFKINVVLKDVYDVVVKNKMWISFFLLFALVLANYCNILNSNYLSFAIALTGLLIVFFILAKVKGCIASIKVSRELFHIFRYQLHDMHKAIIFVMISKGGTATLSAVFLPRIYEINRLGFIYGKIDNVDNKKISINAFLNITLKPEAVRMINSKRFKNYRKTLSTQEIEKIEEVTKTIRGK